MTHPTNWDQSRYHAVPVFHVHGGTDGVGFGVGGAGVGFGVGIDGAGGALIHGRSLHVKPTSSRQVL